MPVKEFYPDSKQSLKYTARKYENMCKVVELQVDKYSEMIDMLNQFISLADVYRETGILVSIYYFLA